LPDGTQPALKSTTVQTHARRHFREGDLAFVHEVPDQPDRGIVIAGRHKVRGRCAASWSVAIERAHRFQPGKKQAVRKDSLVPARSKDRQGGADAFAWPRLFLLRSCRAFGVPPVSVERKVRCAAPVERLARTTRRAAGDADGLAARDRDQEDPILFDRTFAMRRDLAVL